jgi:DNA-binding transcriptional LysR family regulator
MGNGPKQLHYKQNRLQQLRGFCHVVQTGSISKAAERMFLSQPSVSLQIQALERELNVILFERNGPHLKLTPEGETLYSLGRPLVDGMDMLYEQFNQRYSDLDSGSVHIAAGHSVIHYILGGVSNDGPISLFTRKFPNIAVKIANMVNQTALAALRTDEVDLALTAIPQKHDGFVCHPLYSYNTVLIMPIGHPLANRENISLKDIVDYPLILPPEDMSTIPELEQTFKQHGLEYRTKIEVGGLALVKRFVEADLGISIVSSICLEKKDRLATFVLTDYFSPRIYGLILRRGRFMSPQTKALMNLLRSHQVVENLKQSGTQSEHMHILRQPDKVVEGQRA